MENPVWIVVLTRSAYFRDPENAVRELVGQWATIHRGKVYRVLINYKRKKKYFGLVKTVSATITYSKISDED